MSPTSTVAVAKLFLVITTLPSPTVSTIPSMLEQPVRPIKKNTSVASYQATLPTQIFVGRANDDSLQFDKLARHTTEPEKIIGELRQLSLMEENWDDEGADKPSNNSISDSVSFVRLIRNETKMPEPMLHSSGNVSLYWNDNELYADIEFLGDGRIAYFIKNNQGKHKGVLSFDSQEMPTVFSALVKI